ncbi:MAG: GNAT family N-acetyltransferase [Planctomycetaceae bacterium]|nr:GNAT family N-acetyltransferase [Planctomycetaceae bacterium]
MPAPPAIRLATAADLAEINRIYNHYVPQSTTTYDEAPWTIQQREAWFAGRQACHPVTVAVLTDDDGGEVIVGWGSLHPFRSRSAYRFTAENSVYVAPEQHRQGIGSTILADQIERAKAAELKAIIAVIDAEQTASIALHAKLGYEQVGRFPKIGRKFDRWLDVVFMQRVL